MGEALKSIKEYAVVAFTLLGVLFGMIIMTFIFGSLSNANIGAIDDQGVTHLNKTGAFINQTGYTIPEASFANFSGSVVVISAVNSSSGALIASGNYTMNPTTGRITNATNTVWTAVNLSYSLTQKTEQKISVENVQNNSLQGIVSYTNNSSTQFNTVSIAIILVLLIGVFLIFWRIFVANKEKKARTNKYGSFGGNFG